VALPWEVLNPVQSPAWIGKYTFLPQSRIVLQVVIRPKVWINAGVCSSTEGTVHPADISSNTFSCCTDLSHKVTMYLQNSSVVADQGSARQ